jgi:uncharacterized membrane protein YtjA (UPF0391 family)
VGIAHATRVDVTGVIITRRCAVLYYALVFFIIAIIAAAFGFFGIAGAATSIAKILFLVFLALFVITLLLGRRTPPVT